MAVKALGHNAVSVVVWSDGSGALAGFRLRQIGTKDAEIGSPKAFAALAQGLRTAYNAPARAAPPKPPPGPNEARQMQTASACRAGSGSTAGAGAELDSGSECLQL